MTKKLLPVLAVLATLSVVGCSSSPAPKPPPKHSLSSQPHNRPASWEAAGALGGIVPQYQD